MKQCWSEGELRAYLDRELPPEDLQLVAAHLAECPACEALRVQLAGRAARVSALMGALAEPQPVVWTPPMPRPARTWQRWAMAATALAAGLVVAVVVLPTRTERPPEAVRTSAVQPLPVEQALTQPEPPRQLAPGRRRPRPQVFLALDDEPIETGVVMRVALGDGEVPADVIFGPEGRARAIRLVK
jgi:anti-sigma factor RsiW